ncbi:MAG: hypothetical protein GX949_06610 [Peptococcaceae bacterium]|jgi:hypothetical protein|nr:hypothetical protein [Peptococcaceae bacterium]
MKKLLVLMIALVMALCLAACGGEDTPEAAHWPYENVTQDQIQAIADVLTELEPLYNEAVVLAEENGWEADETAVQELNTIYVLLDAGKHGVAAPSEYGETSKEDMDVVVEQYQVILGAMPDLIAKLSEPYEN